MDSPVPPAEPLNCIAAARQGRQAPESNEWCLVFGKKLMNWIGLIVKHRGWQAEYGERWGEGAARYFSIEADFLDEARKKHFWVSNHFNGFAWDAWTMNIVRLQLGVRSTTKISSHFPRVWAPYQDQSIRLMPVPESQDLRLQSCQSCSSSFFLFSHYALMPQRFLLPYLRDHYAHRPDVLDLKRPSAAAFSGQTRWPLWTAVPMRGITLRGGFENGGRPIKPSLLQPQAMANCKLLFVPWS